MLHCNCEWNTSENKPEKSSYTLELSSFNYTLSQKQDKNPKIKLTDIKVRGKTKSNLLQNLALLVFPEAEVHHN